MTDWISRSVTCHTSNFSNLLLHVCYINIIPTPASVPPKGWRPTCTALWASAGQSSWYPYFGDRHLNKYHFTDHGAGNLAPIWYVGMCPTADHLQPDIVIFLWLPITVLYSLSEQNDDCLLVALAAQLLYLDWGEQGFVPKTNNWACTCW